MLTAVCLLMMTAQTLQQGLENCETANYYYANRCDTCNTGYYVNKKNSYKCDACLPNCETCTTGDTCSKCYLGSSLNSSLTTCTKISGRRTIGYILAFGAIALLYITVLLCLKFNKSTHYTPVSANPLVNQQLQTPVAGENMHQFQPQPQAGQLPPGFS